MTRAMAFFGAAGVALFVTLQQWMQRTGAALVDLSDLGGSAVLAMASVGIGWFFAGWLACDADRRGLIALVAGVWAPLSGTVQVLLSVSVHDTFRNPWIANGAWTAARVAAVALCARSRVPLGFATRAIAFASGFMLLNLGVQIRAKFPAAAAVPPRITVQASDIPSIYLLVVDKYSSGTWMRHTYGVDQTAFEDSLRQEGFFVPTAARANYSHTHLSLASFLNWRYLDADADGEGGPPWGRTKSLIAEARTWKEARSRGYRLVTFPTWYTGTSTVTGADLTLRYPASGRRFEARFGETWLINSPFASLLNRACDGPECSRGAVSPFPVESLAEQRWKLETFASFADSAGPTFAFLHLLLPHEPYLFTEACEPREPWWPSTDQGDAAAQVEAAYAAQVRCTAPLLLETIRRIRARSTTPSVILIQSDHGHGRLFTDLLRGFTLSAEDATDAQIGERHAVFAAYHFPGADTTIADDGSMVNVLRAVARVAWRDTTPPLPDSAFFSTYQDAFRFTALRPGLTVPRAAPR